MKKLTRVERKRKRKRFFLRLILLIAIISITVSYSFKSGKFSIESIVVKGNYKISKELITNTSGIIIGENIFRVKTSDGEKEIKTLPYIKDVKIERKLPRTININVLERVEIVQMKALSSYMLIDNEGYILEFVDSKNENLPTLVGFDINNVIPGDNIYKFESGKELEELLSMDNHIILSKISEIIYESKDDINIIVNNGISVAFGPLDNVKYKLRYLNEILIDIEKRQLPVKMILMNKGENPILVTDN